MLLLRKGGHFTDRQIDKYLGKALLYFSIALVTFFVSWYVKRPELGVVGVGIAILLFKASSLGRFDARDRPSFAPVATKGRQASRKRLEFVEAG